MALRFTADGVVGAPTSLQIRLGPGRPGRVRVGAPVPSRTLTEAEVLDNVRYFRDPGPRSAPIEVVVLSGVPDPWLASRIPPIAEGVRSLGIRRLVLHLDEIQGRSLAASPAGCDLVVTSADPAALDAVPAGIALTIPLERVVLDDLDAAMSAAERLRPARVTWVWPFPDGTSARPASAASVAAVLAGSLGRWTDAPFSWGIKGLPRCALSPLERVVSLRDRIWRTRNRYYVDADHQRPDALMFEPDLVRLVKSDGCRFCAVDDRCDGVAARWLAEGLVAGLPPLEAS